MIRIGVVGCTGKLGSMIVKTIYNQSTLKLMYVFGRKGNQHIGKDISEIIGGTPRNLFITDNINVAKDCDVFIDCTN